MKQLFILLLCVGTCLAAAAITPQVRDAQIVAGKSITPVKKQPGKDLLAGHHFSGLTSTGMNTLSVPQFFKGTGHTPNDNRLMKRAPRRVSPNDIVNDKLVFYEVYSLDMETGMVTPENIFNYGGWFAYIQEIDNGVYSLDDMFYSGIPLTMNVDYDNNTAQLELDYLYASEWSDTTRSGTTTIINDTTEYLFVFDEDYLLGYSDEPANLTGKVFDDGSIYFEGGYVYYLLDCTSKAVIRNGRTTMTYDTIENCSPILRNTYLLTPNAFQSYVNTADNSNYGNYAYMYQYDDSTAVIWNLYGLGYNSNYMYIHSDGTASFPTLQYAGDMAFEREVLEELYPEYDWSDADHTRIMGYNEELGEADYEMDAIAGTVTPDQLCWGPTALSWWCVDPQTGYWSYAYIPPYIDNQLTFINGDTWDIEEKTPMPEISYETQGNYVEVTATGVGTVMLYFYIDENESPIVVENPYRITRTGEDKVYYFAAIAIGEGMAPSEPAYAAVFVPALEVIPGDVNGDNIVDIADITSMIVHLLDQNYDDPNFNTENADVDMDGSIDLNDLIVLIHNILNAR